MNKILFNFLIVGVLLAAIQGASAGKSGKLPLEERNVNTTPRSPVKIQKTLQPPPVRKKQAPTVSCAAKVCLENRSYLQAIVHSVISGKRERNGDPIDCRIRLKTPFLLEDGPLFVDDQVEQ
ncbi:MAG: hypothetical protein H0X26_06070 [Alphaproteobacteria bacterium]|nr:hypothetical protein [Alphaproteobacteria bacterium]